MMMSGTTPQHLVAQQRTGAKASCWLRAGEYTPAQSGLIDALRYRAPFIEAE
jgi:hypothetical protein